MIPSLESGDTPQFTWASVTAPDSRPILKIFGVAATVVASITSVQSDATHYYALYTLPTSEGYYRGEWTAQKTIAGSAYQLTDRFTFKVTETRVP